MRGWRVGLALAAGAALVLSGLSCASVLGLDEPTHRGTGGNQGTAGGGDSGSGGGPSSGGAAGTIDSSGGGGGSSGSNATGSGGMSGAGGSSAGAASDAGDASAPRDAGTDATPAGCQGKYLCDDFESVAVGAVPDSAKWSIDPNALASNGISIDSTKSYRGKNSVRIQAGAGVLGPMMFSNTVPLAIGSMWYIRAFLYVSDQAGGSAGGFLALRDTANPTKYLVLGFNNGAMAYSFQGAGVNQLILPSNAAQLMSSYRLQAAKWVCIEMRYDAANTQIHTWVDEVDIAALRADGTATPDVDDTWTNMMPRFQPSPTVGFGWWPQQGSSATVYLDDVAIDSKRIGCN